jgi:hypothetical protein
MTVAELALLITTLSGAIAALIGAMVALMKTRTESELSRHERNEQQKENAELKKQIEELRQNRITDRRDIIVIGEQLSGTRLDVSKLVVLVNKLYTDYQKDTGHKPDIDWETFDRFITVQHITTPLGPLQVKD